ncbi:RidA family protein [Paenibacillus ginsengihumi]|uniref:RidA family protein n=1 Tax=Paenibacillus ginsengihumi TaxID=431596 RepID=UPI00037993FB|nr:RidA family protein [Paenibacillus ginsengihumi]
MEMDIINPATLTDAGKKLIAQIKVAPASRLAFISGQVALNEKGELVGPGDYRLQAIQVFTNLKLAIEAAGGRPDQVAQMKIYVVKHNAELAKLVFAAGMEVFGPEWPLAASTYLGVESLGLPEWLIEADAIVALPPEGRF